MNTDTFLVLTIGFRPNYAKSWRNGFVLGVINLMLILYLAKYNTSVHTDRFDLII